MMELLSPVDTDELATRVANAIPYPYFYLDNFLQEDFANEVYESFPSFGESQNLGRTFDAVNERYKVQITDSGMFPPAILRLHQLLASDDFIGMLGKVMNMTDLQADPEMNGGGIHETGPGGHLDVHVDFNRHARTGYYRRLNILVFFNKGWKEEYGGKFEIWDPQVSKCHSAILPVFNRVACFATSESSFHGVTAVHCPQGMCRKSFAGYYYTQKAPENWSDKQHTTIFRARPNEKFKGKVLMPLEAGGRMLRQKIRYLKSLVHK